MKIKVFQLILTAAIFCGCAKQTASPEIFEKFMGAKLPANCQIGSFENKRDAGAIFVVHISKNNFFAFTNNLHGYSEWHSLTNQIDFQAADKTFHALNDLRGEYAVGKFLGGTRQVLVWDESSETLTAMLATFLM